MKKDIFKGKGKGQSADFTGRKVHHDPSPRNFESPEPGHKPTSHTVAAHSGHSTPAHVVQRAHHSKISLFKH